MLVKRITSKMLGGLWFVPLVYAFAGIVINVVTVAIDRANDHDLVPIDIIGGPDAALAILGSVSASMIGLVATVLAITMVVVQLAMAQFSPRIVQTFLQDRPSQNAIGLFVATFVHSMLSMREVQVSEDDPVVPGVSILVTLAMVLVDVVVLVIYIHHIGRALRVSSLIEMVGSETRDLAESLYPDSVGGAEPAQADPAVVTAPSSGVLIMVGHEPLVALARGSGAVIRLVPSIGEFVPAGAPLARIDAPHPERLDHAELRKALVLGQERTLDQDVAFGLRMLVDMGLKAVADSPLADPSTTVQVIDRVHDILRQLSSRDLTDGSYADEQGQERLVVPAVTWHAYVQLGFEELRLAGTESPQITRRLRSSLVDLIEAAPPDRRDPLHEQLELLDGRIERLTEDEHDLTVAQEPDALGLGGRR